MKFLDFDVDSGVVKSIDGEEYLKNEPCIKSYKFNFKEGDYIKKPENDSVRVGYYIICAESRKKFDEVMANVCDKLKIIIGE